MAVLPPGPGPVLSMQDWSNQIMGNQAGYQSVQQHYNQLAQYQNMTASMMHDSFPLQRGMSFHGPNSTFQPDEQTKPKAAPKVDSLPSEKEGLTEAEVAKELRDTVKKRLSDAERAKLYPPAHKWRSPLGFQSRWTFDNPLKPVHKWWIRLMFRLFSRKISKNA